MGDDALLSTAAATDDALRRAEPGAVDGALSSSVVAGTVGLSGRITGRSSWREAVARARDGVAPLFAPVRPTPVGFWSILGAVAVTVAIACYSLLRVGGAGALDSIWAEDGANFLSDVYMLPSTHTIFRPLNGYFLVVPRLISLSARLVPVAWGPAVLSVGAATVSAATAVMIYVACGTVLRRPLLRAVAAFWVVAAPLAESTYTFGPNMVASLQFVELYGLFWILLWTPARRSARAVQLAFVVACGMSTFLAVLLLPIAVLRCWARRDRLAIALASLLLAGAAFQTSGIVLGLTDRAISHPRLDLPWALAGFAGWALPFSVVGEKIMSDAGFVQPGVHSGGGGPWYWGGVAASWLLVSGAVLVALRRLTDAHWLFAAVAWAQAALLLCAQVAIQGRLELRYAYTPGLIAVAGLLGLVRPWPTRRHVTVATRLVSWLPALALVTALGVSAGVNYRIATTRSAATPWSTVVRRSAATCRAAPATPFVVAYSTPVWFAVVPCRLLRENRR